MSFTRTHIDPTTDPTMVPTYLALADKALAAGRYWEAFAMVRNAEECGFQGEHPCRSSVAPRPPAVEPEGDYIEG